MLIIDIGALLVLPLISLLMTRNNIVAFLTLLFVVVFMYSPSKIRSNYNQNIFYSPSAGFIKNITETDTNIHITLFLNVFDNHTQYFPIESVLLFSKRVHGVFEPAYREHSINNEKVEHTLQSVKHGFKYTITQITGLLTRRILVIAEKEKKYKAGSRLGFIMFGSRVDITIPKYNIRRILAKPQTHIQEMSEIIELKT
jgi:phosphatidylserine decarboxylase